MWFPKSPYRGINLQGAHLRSQLQLKFVLEHPEELDNVHEFPRSPDLLLRICT